MTTTTRPLALSLAVPGGSLGAHDVDGLVTEVECRWLAASRHWVAGREVVVEDDAVRVIGRAALAWAGIRTSLQEEDAVARRLAGAGDPTVPQGDRGLQPRWSRRRLETWATAQVRAARRGRPSPPPGSLLDVLAARRNEHGHVTPAPDTAPGLLRVLQPVVALSGLVALGARELVRRPGWRASLRAERAERTPGTGPGPLALAFGREVIADRRRGNGASRLTAGPTPLVPDQGTTGDDVATGVLAVSCAVLSTVDWIEPPRPKGLAEHRLLSGSAGRVRLGMVRGPWPGSQHGR
jgi:hypothetical protein